MGVENVAKFLRQMKKDPELNKQFLNLVKLQNEMFMGNTIELGKAYGYDFQKEDLKAFTERAAKQNGNNQQLTTKHLEQIAGSYYFHEHHPKKPPTS